MLFQQPAIKQRRLHFIGIGGIGMSGIAEILLNSGYEISGSDLRRSPTTDRLETLGARVFEGHLGSHVVGADVVVRSSAVPDDNPELIAARAAGLPVIRRGELLAELMRLKYGVAVAGSHGKTTTTSMTAAVLQGGGKDPTVVVGGRVDAMGSNARLGKSDILLVEADESDGSFLKLAPIVAVITNVDREHLDHYESLEALEQAFVDFADKAPFYGSAILCLDDPTLRRLRPRVSSRVLTYGTAERSPDADVRISEVERGHLRTRFALRRDGLNLGRFEVRGVGLHNVLNATAAVAVGLELDLTPEAAREGLAGFSGVDRRFQIRGERGGVTVIDDYGHHPTEIAATLGAARDCDFKRLLVIFQPHRYSRTRLLADEFATCFGDCDRLFVVDVYAASEEPIPGADAEALTARIRRAGHDGAEYCGSMEAAVERAARAAEPGDAIITLGAGSVSRLGEPLLKALEERFASASAGAK